jgi:hypothetical protein
MPGLFSCWRVLAAGKARFSAQLGRTIEISLHYNKLSARSVAESGHRGDSSGV